MRFYLSLLALSTLAFAQKDCPAMPAPLECGKDTWNCPEQDSNGCITGFTCIPMKIGECWNLCPMTCFEKQKSCPVGVAHDGCPMPDMCIPDDGKYYLFLNPQGKYSKQQLK